MIVRVFIASLVLALAAAAQPIDDAAKHAVLDELQTVLVRQAYVGGVNFTLWPKHLAAHREAIDDAGTANQFAGAVNAALSNFGISHLALVPPGVMERAWKTESIGIGVETRAASGGLRVMGVPADSPAAESGLGAGDLIVAVDAKRPTRPEDLEGPADSTAVLRVRKLDGAVREVRVSRRIVDRREPATFRELTDLTALIRVPTFAAGYEDAEVADLVARALPYRNLIIDLRGNGGGRVSSLLQLLSTLVPAETLIGTSVANVTAARYVEATGGDPSDAAAVAAWSPEKSEVPPNTVGPYPGRLAVLIDGRSASASEVTAAALREVRGAVVVGQTSAGALLVSSYLELPGGFRVQTPIRDYITIRGLRPEGVGVKPDIEVRPGRGERDAPVERARIALEGI